MNILRNVAVVLGVILVGTHLTYEYVLSNNQRKDVRNAMNELETIFTDTYDAIASVLPNVSTKAEEMAAVESNRQRTRQQWEAIGF